MASAGGRADRPDMAAESVCTSTKDFLRSARVFAWSVREVFERQVLREVAGSKLTFSQLKLLYFVAHTGTHTVSDAAAFLGVSKAAASKAVQKLVERRMLRRVALPWNRRSSQLALTPASRRVLNQFESARDRLAAEVFAQVSSKQLQQTAETLDRLAAAIARRSVTRDEVCLRCEVYYCQPCRFGEWGERNCFYLGHARGPGDAPGHAGGGRSALGSSRALAGSSQASAVGREG